MKTKKYIIIFALFLINQVVFSQSKTTFDIARSGSVKEMNVVFKKNKKIINAVDDRKSSLLILACYRGNNDVAKFLIDKKADLDYNSPNGTALMACVVKGNIEIAEILLNKGAKINCTDGNGTTALMFAVQFNNKDMVELLLKNNADKTIKDKNGKTAFEFAVFSGNDEIINLLK
jgi:ankyrin repeat protein